MRANLEEVITLIRKSPLEDFDKLREIVEKEISLDALKIKMKSAPNVR